jgi:hypothetical protein
MGKGLRWAEPTVWVGSLDPSQDNMLRLSVATRGALFYGSRHHLNIRQPMPPIILKIEQSLGAMVSPEVAHLFHQMHFPEDALCALSH